MMEARIIKTTFANGAIAYQVEVRPKWPVLRHLFPWFPCGERTASLERARAQKLAATVISEEVVD